MSQLSKKKILFDFDGVLVDSAYEMMMPAYTATTGTTVTDPAQLPAGYAEAFLLNRPHLRPAGDAIPLAKLALRLDSPRQVSPAEWQEAIALETAPLSERTAGLFAARKALISFNPERWLAFNRPYSALVTALKIQPNRVIVLTNKNRQAVVELLAYYGVSVPEDQIFTGDGGRTKEENLKVIAQRFGEARYTFLEDSLENLIEVRDSAPEMIHPVLADWGYVRADDILHAQSLGIEVVSQEQFIEKYL